MFLILLGCAALQDPGEPCDGSCAYSPIGLELYAESWAGSLMVTDDALTWRAIDDSARWGDFDAVVLEVSPLVPVDCESANGYPSALGVGWRVETDTGSRWDLMPVVDVLTVQHGSEIGYCPEVSHEQWRIVSQWDDVATATPL